MGNDFFVCLRDCVEGVFQPDPGKAAYLFVPEDASDIHPAQGVSRDEWVRAVIDESRAVQTPRGKGKKSAGPALPYDADDSGNILVFIHGYNSTSEIVLQRHRQLKKDLWALGFRGTVVSYDWPSDNSELGYLEDRRDARLTSIGLVDNCIRLFVKMQDPVNCEINVHLLAHSTGAFVIREAFDDADDRTSLAAKNWTVSQVMLIGGDVSSASMAAGNAKTDSLYRHCIRLTNYWNPYDDILKLSNVKRVGVAPRVGRAGLPQDAPAKAVDVGCGEYFKTLNEKKANFYGTFCHSWHIGDPVFTRDILETMRGSIDREYIPTRRMDGRGELILTPAPEPAPAAAAKTSKKTR